MLDQQQRAAMAAKARRQASAAGGAPPPKGADERVARVSGGVGGASTGRRLSIRERNESTDSRSSHDGSGNLTTHMTTNRV